MAAHTQLTQQHLKIYPSQRNTDTEDGGGLMVGTPLTGALNEIFNPVSRLDRTLGGFDLRLIYPAVSHEAAVSLLGASVMISQRPQQPDVSVLLMKGDFYGQERASIQERAEGYRVATVESRMTLLGKQRKGARQVQAYQNAAAPLPVVGEVFALRLVVDNAEVFEFFRVAQLSHELRVFEDDKGEFVRRVLNLTTNQALERDFVGMEEPSRFKASPPARVMNTQIADSARYYGISACPQELKAGEVAVKVDSVYAQLVPVSTVETALADDWAQGREIWIPSAPERVVFGGGVIRNTLYLDTPVLPTSVKWADWQDDGLGNLKNGDERLSIDYAQGVISGLGTRQVPPIRAIPAVRVRNYAYSSYVNIDDTNVGTEWAPLLRPAPARGSVQVSYRAGRTWYQLSDYGDLVLRDENGQACGSVTAAGSCLISLPAMPDSGSPLLISWCPNNYYHTLDEQAAGQVIAPIAAETDWVLPPVPIAPLQPGSVQLNWRGGQARDDGQGRLSGGCTGVVNYATGQIRPLGLSAPSVELNAKQFSALPNTRSVPVKIAAGAKRLSLVAGSLQPGSLKLSLSLTRTTQTQYTVPAYRLVSGGTR